MSDPDKPDPIDVLEAAKDFFIEGGLCERELQQKADNFKFHLGR